MQVPGAIRSGLLFQVPDATAAGSYIGSLRTATKLEEKLEGRERGPGVTRPPLATYYFFLAVFFFELPFFFAFFFAAILSLL